MSPDLNDRFSCHLKLCVHSVEGKMLITSLLWQIRQGSCLSLQILRSKDVSTRMVALLVSCILLTSCKAVSHHMRLLVLEVVFPFWTEAVNIPQMFLKAGKKGNYLWWLLQQQIHILFIGALWPLIKSVHWDDTLEDQLIKGQINKFAMGQEISGLFQFLLWSPVQ